MHPLQVPQGEAGAEEPAGVRARPVCRPEMVDGSLHDLRVVEGQCRQLGDAHQRSTRGPGGRLVRHNVAEDAKRYCQTRFLCEKYGLPLPAALGGFDVDDVEPVIDPTESA